MSGPGVSGSATLAEREDTHDPVLRSKITQPEFPTWAVLRPRIGNRMAEGTRGPLTVVTGPPGAGKTMAIAAWSASASRPGILAWLTVDEYDNGPGAFWGYLVAALRQAGVTVPAFVPGQGRAAADHAFAARLAAVLAAQDPPVVLVLDDLHHLTEPSLLDGISYLLRNAAPGLRLVVASRTDPLLPVHRYRVAGQLAEIMAEDLAFTAQESRLLMERHGVSLPASMLEHIIKQTEGWAAGMRLAGLSLRGHPEPGQFIRELESGDSAITGYLVEEVLNPEPAAVRDMMLRTSVLDRFSADLATELTDDPRWADALPALARANSFVRPLGSGWYCYHPLLAAALRLRLGVERRVQLLAVYQRAARWCHRNGRLGEAVRYAAKSGDWQLAAEMVVDEFATGQLIEVRGHQPPAETHGRQPPAETYGHQPLAEAFGDMPADHGWAQPQPWLVQAATRLRRGASEACGAALDLAETILGHQPEDEQLPSRLTAALIRLALARRTGDADGVTASSAGAEVAAGRLPVDTRTRHPEVLAQLLAGQGTVRLWAGQLEAAAGCLAEGAAACAEHMPHEQAEFLGSLALVEALSGRLGRAAERAGEAAEAARNGGDVAGRPVSGAAVAMAWVHLQRGDMRQAQVKLRLADTALQACPDKLVSTLARGAAALRLLVMGRPAIAAEMIRLAGEEWSPSPPRWLDARLAMLESRACAAAGDAPAAVAAAQRADPEPDAAAALAHAWLTAGDQEAARRALDAVGPAGAVGAESSRLEVALADARLSYGAGDGARGRRCLERALRLARPEQERLPFVMERTWLRPILRHDPELAHAYRELLGPDAVDAVPVAFQDPASPAAQVAPLVVEQLSAREREVLAHASEMLSTAEIATEMFLSVNTVKTHLRSIYRKLSATHRSEAVRRAQQLRLL